MSSLGALASMAMYLFLGAIVAVIVGAIFKRKTTRLAWSSAAAVLFAFAAVSPSVDGRLGAYIAVLVLAILAAFATPLIRYSK